MTAPQYHSAATPDTVEPDTDAMSPADTMRAEIVHSREVLAEVTGTQLVDEHDNPVPSDYGLNGDAPITEAPAEYPAGTITVPLADVELHILPVLDWPTAGNRNLMQGDVET